MIFKFYLLDHLEKYLEPILHFFSIYQIVFLQPKKKKKNGKLMMCHSAIF